MTLVDLSPGKRLAGRFTIVAPHRRGGLSAALEVREGDSDERLELQLFPAGLFDDPDQVRSFAEGLAPWKEVRSPHVLAVREVLFLDPSNVALVTDFPEGESLRERLNERGPLPAGETAALGLALLEGLEAVHALGLVHGDVKPYTIHVSEGERGLEPVLVDGGVTPGLWRVKGLGEKTALIGTPYYAPVEQFGGDAPDVRSDVYNVATVLYECLTGVLPWPGKTYLEVFQAKLSEVPPPMRERAPGIEVDPHLEETIVRGCRADRRKRYGSAEAFREALERSG